MGAASARRANASTPAPTRSAAGRPSACVASSMMSHLALATRAGRPPRTAPPWRGSGGRACRWRCRRPRPRPARRPTRSRRRRAGRARRRACARAWRRAWPRSARSAGRACHEEVNHNSHFEGKAASAPNLTGSRDRDPPSDPLAAPRALAPCPRAPPPSSAWSRRSSSAPTGTASSRSTRRIRPRAESARMASSGVESVRSRSSGFAPSAGEGQASTTEISDRFVRHAAATTATSCRS